GAAVVADREDVRGRAVEVERERHGDIGRAVVAEAQRGAGAGDVDEVAAARTGHRNAIETVGEDAIGAIAAAAGDFRRVTRGNVLTGPRGGDRLRRAGGRDAVELERAAIGNRLVQQRED